MTTEDLDKLFPDERNKKKDKLDKLKEIELRLLKIFDHICKKHKINYSLAFGTLLGAIRHQGFIPWDDDIDLIMTLKNYNLFLKHVGEFPKSVFFQTMETDNIEWGKPFAAKLRDNNSQVDFGESHHSGAFIDIFIFDGISSNKFVSFFQKIFLISMRMFSTIENKKGIFKDRKRLSKFFLKRMIVFPRKILKTLGFVLFLEKLYAKIFKEKDTDNYCLHWFPYKFLTMEKKEIFPIKKMKFEGTLFPILRNYDKFLKHLYGNYMKLPPKNQQIIHFDLNKIKI